MYLQTAANIEGILEYGIKPLIAFADALEAARETGDEENADLYQVEIKGRLLRVAEAINVLMMADRAEKMSNRKKDSEESELN